MAIYMVRIHETTRVCVPTLLFPYSYSLNKKKTNNKKAELLLACQVIHGRTVHLLPDTTSTHIHTIFLLHLFYVYMCLHTQLFTITLQSSTIFRTVNVVQAHSLGVIGCAYGPGCSRLYHLGFCRCTQRCLYKMHDGTYGLFHLQPRTRTLS